MASDASSPGQLVPPYYDLSGGSGQPSGSSGLPSPPSAPSLAQATGLGCLPSQVQGEYLTRANKLRVLNCLVFETPHSFWVTDGNGVRQADTLRTDPAKWGWLGTDGDWDWSCTWSPDGPMPSCLKHDVAYSGLQKFAGASPGQANGSELDATWNPRNKALIDAKFKADVARYGCQNAKVGARLACLLPKEHLAGLYFHGVTAGFWIFESHRGWPVTEQDLTHTLETPTFIDCGDNPVPTLDVGAVTRLRGADQSYQATLTANRGCVEDIAIDHYLVFWEVTLDTGLGLARPAISPIRPSQLQNGTGSATFPPTGFPAPPSYAVTSLVISLTEIVPRDHRYGPESYVLPQSRLVYRSD